MRGVLAGRRDQSHSNASINIRRTRSQKTLLRRLSAAPVRGYCMALFTGLGTDRTRRSICSCPDLRARRRVAGAFSRGFFRAAGIPLRVQGIDALAAATHAWWSRTTPATSTASSPSRLCRPTLRSSSRKRWCACRSPACCCGASAPQFVERFDRHKGAADARRVWKLAATGQSLVFFPEGTFDATAPDRQVSWAAHSRRPNARKCPSSPWPSTARARSCRRGSLMLRRKPIRFEILEVLHPDGARQRSRELIAQAVGEPLAP